MRSAPVWVPKSDDGTERAVLEGGVVARGYHCGHRRRKPEADGRLWERFPMYRVDRNNFYRHQKSATVYTPPEVSQFLFGVLHDKIDRSGVVMDPCVGAGSLLAR